MIFKIIFKYWISHKITIILFRPFFLLPKRGLWADTENLVWQIELCELFFNIKNLLHVTSGSINDLIDRFWRYSRIVSNNFRFSAQVSFCGFWQKKLETKKVLTRKEAGLFGNFRVCKNHFFTPVNCSKPN